MVPFQKDHSTHAPSFSSPLAQYQALWDRAARWPLGQQEFCFFVCLIVLTIAPEHPTINTSPFGSLFPLVVFFQAHMMPSW